VPVKKDPHAEWDRIMEKLRAEILRKGIHPEHGHFIEAYDSDKLDAANLRLSLVGFIKADEPAMRRTIEAAESQLKHLGLVYRRTTAEKSRPENAFLFCSFWLVQNLALLKRTDEATELFEKLLGYANDLGLYSEESDPQTRRMFGNFPQAFTHIGLINAAYSLWKLHE
jgi:GH15 family glucan-1,4-alpha-glucosidase